MRGPTPERLKSFLTRQYRLASYLSHPGDGRLSPRIPAEALLWSLLIGQILRETSFHAIEALIRSTARPQLEVACRFGDDALGYFTERLDPLPTRRALVSMLRTAKRNKAFEKAPWVGLALDGTGAGRSGQARCPLCHPRHDAQNRVIGYNHHLCQIGVVGTGLSLPFDAEGYPPGDSEQAAGRRLLERAVGLLGKGFADYVVADSLHASAPFLHTAGDLGLRAVVRLKANLPELWEAAQQRFSQSPPSMVIEEGGERVELWDDDGFDPWETLRWSTVRVLRYRQYKRDGTVMDAYWLTDWPSSQVGSRTLYRMAKSRWEIENQGFNEEKTYHAMEHIAHHHENSLLLCWLLLLLALVIERLYRLRYLHRGTHKPRSAIELVRVLRLSLAPQGINSS